MIDVRLLRSNLDGVREALGRRGKPDVLAMLDEAVRHDERSREITAERDTIRARVNELSKQVGGLRREGKTSEAEALQAESRNLGDKEAALSNEADTVHAALRECLLRIPNLPHADAPSGADDSENPVMKGPVNMPASFADHQRVPHWETAVALGILDNERATKISGAMFTMQRGLGATLSRALCQYALDMNADAFEEIRPPSLVTTATLTATGQLPKFEQDLFAVRGERPLYLIPTAEVPVTNIFRDVIVKTEDLPVKLCAYTPCFRREAGSYGAHVRGLNRLHQFDKV
ncbi:MAG: seryl-tRNA synthetase, partial [Actinomycetota bacterium]